MGHASAIASRFREAIFNGTWVAYTNYKKELEGLHWQVATRQVGNLNTIAALARHIHYYVQGIIPAFTGGSLEIRDKYSFDFPPLASQQQWDDFLNRFWADAETLAQHMEALADEKLAEPFTDEKFGNFLRNLNGMIEHCYYHLGQIVLIKKLAFAEPATSN